MKYIIPLIIFLFSCKTEYRSNLQIQTNCIPQSISINEENINNINPEIILSAVAWKECRNLNYRERWLVMEALWNRVTRDFNCNGGSFYHQMIAPKQMPNIFNNLVFDNTNSYHLENYIMAQKIIEGERLSKTIIYYWASPNDIHYRWCKRQNDINSSINRITTIHKFR